MTEESIPKEGAEKTANDPLIGKDFAGKYEIISVIGRGGMSTVYKAKHKYMERMVALKVLHKHLISDPTSVERFKKESKAASSLSHPNIITVFDFGVDFQNQFSRHICVMVTDFTRGQSAFFEDH